MMTLPLGVTVDYDGKHLSKRIRNNTLAGSIKIIGKSFDSSIPQLFFWSIFRIFRFNKLINWQTTWTVKCNVTHVTSDYLEMPNVLYHDLQASEQNAFYTAATFKAYFSEKPLHLFQLGSDSVEHLFRNVRTQVMIEIAIFINWKAV